MSLSKFVALSKLVWAQIGWCFVMVVMMNVLVHGGPLVANALGGLLAWLWSYCT